MEKDYKGFLELIAKVAEIDKDTALHLIDRLNNPENQMENDYKGFLELVAKVAKIDKNAALYLIEMSAMSKKKQNKLNFTVVNTIYNVMTWRETKQGYSYWLNISDVLIRSSFNK